MKKNRKTIERLDYSLEDENKIAVNLSKKNYEFARKYCKDNSLILDLGCGLGWGTNYLSSKGKVIGIDIDGKTIKEAKRRYGENKKIKFIATDALILPYKNEWFDVIVSIENIEHVNNYIDYINETKRVLKKNGLLIVSTPNREHFGCRLRRLLKIEQKRNPFHLHEFSENELVALLKDNEFRIIKRRRAVFILPLTVLNFIEKNNILSHLVTIFTLPGFNANFQIVACKK